MEEANLRKCRGVPRHSASGKLFESRVFPETFGCAFPGCTQRHEKSSGVIESEGSGR